jgi:hypothetical protein
VEICTVVIANLNAWPDRRRLEDPQQAGDYPDVPKNLPPVAAEAEQCIYSLVIGIEASQKS